MEKIEELLEVLKGMVGSLEKFPDELLEKVLEELRTCYLLFFCSTYSTGFPKQIIWKYAGRSYWKNSWMNNFKLLKLFLKCFLKKFNWRIYATFSGGIPTGTPWRLPEAVSKRIKNKVLLNKSMEDSQEGFCRNRSQMNRYRRMETFSTCQGI